MANRKFMKLNQFPSSIQSPESSPNDYTTHLFKSIFLQFNDEWIYFIPNLFHSLISAISNFFHSILSWLMVIPNFFHSLMSSISNLFHSLFMIIPNLFYSLSSAISSFFHSILSWLDVIPKFFHSLLSSLSNLFHSLSYVISNFFHSILSWLMVIPNFFHSLISSISNLFHSLFMIIPNLFYSLLSAISSFFHSILSWLDVIPKFFHSLPSSLSNLFHSLSFVISNFFHSILSWLNVIPNFFNSLLFSFSNLFHSLSSAISNFFHSILSWLNVIPNIFNSLISSLSNLFHSLHFMITNLCHSLVTKLSVIPNLLNSLLTHILKTTTRFVVAVFWVVLLCLICYYCWPVIARCLTLLLGALMKIIAGFFLLLKGICIMVYDICSCTRAIPSNPASHFSNLRHGSSNQPREQREKASSRRRHHARGAPPNFDYEAASTSSPNAGYQRNERDCCFHHQDGESPVHYTAEHSTVKTSSSSANFKFSAFFPEEGRYSSWDASTSSPNAGYQRNERDCCFHHQDGESPVHYTAEHSTVKTSSSSANFKFSAFFPEESRYSSRDANMTDGVFKTGYFKVPSQDLKSDHVTFFDRQGAKIIFMQSDHKVSCENVASSSDQSNIITDRQKIKETDAYKHAMEEELATRQQQVLNQAREARRLRNRKKEEHRRMMNERRQRQRVKEIRQTMRKDEENLNLKEKYRVEIKKELQKIKASDMASLLRHLGIHVGGGPYPPPNEVQAAYKRACLKFHPDRIISDLRQQVEGEEKFKLISNMKDNCSQNR